MHNGGSSLLSSGGWNNNNNNNLGRRHHQQQPMQQQQQNFGNGTSNGGPSTMMLNPYSKCRTRSNQSCFLSIWLNQTVPKGMQTLAERGVDSAANTCAITWVIRGRLERRSREREKKGWARLKISFESTYRWIPQTCFVSLQCLLINFAENLCWCLGGDLWLTL